MLMQMLNPLTTYMIKTCTSIVTMLSLRDNSREEVSE